MGNLARIRVLRKKPDEIGSNEFLGYYLGISSNTRTDPVGDIRTEFMVSYIQDDGSIGLSNRVDVLLLSEDLALSKRPIITEDVISDEIDSKEDDEEEVIIPT